MIVFCLAFLAAFVCAFVLFKLAIPVLRKLKYGQEVRDDGPQQHLQKQGTPTMGGIVFIITSLVIPWIFYLFDKQNLNATTLLYISAATLGFGLIGFLDDYAKVAKRQSMGLNAKQKILLQLVVGFALAFWAYKMPAIGSDIFIPWVKIYINFSVFYIPFIVVFTIAVVNSVNLTDGLDGLSASVTMIDTVFFALLFALLMQRNSATEIPQNELRTMILFSAAFAGSLLAYIVYNSYPAKIFMGDTGSFAMGGAISALAILSKSELIIPIVGICYLASSVSVILQVGSYKLRNKKRIFLMAPLHHHFELKGYPETKVVEGYRIVTIVACVLALTAF